MNLPITIDTNPAVKVWIRPPMLNITAPLNRVPFRPIPSPIRPAAIEVTARGQDVCTRHNLRGNSLKAPISSTATIVPTSIAFGVPKNLIKWGPVMMPDMTLSLVSESEWAILWYQHTLDHIQTCLEVRNAIHKKQKARNLRGKLRGWRTRK